MSNDRVIEPISKLRAATGSFEADPVNTDSSEPFKACPACGKVWHTRDELLSDPEVELVGYQVHFEDLSLGLMMFNHSCRGTFAVAAEKFLDMYDGPAFDEMLAGKPECPGYCLKKTELRRCPAKCECAFIREILEKITAGLSKARIGSGQQDSA
ncbi:MAG: hypothetical protein JW808_09830 [Victivallales bacterium]|nr:hypothetical protein [Victivallales bacterium]